MKFGSMKFWLVSAVLVLSAALGAQGQDLQIRGKIVWNGSTIVRTMDGDGSNQTSLGVSGTTLDWSPDGTKIANGFGNNIYVMNADGSNSTELPTTGSNDNYPAWSPDGTKIAWETNAGGSNNDVWVMDAADGGNKVNVTNNSAGHDGYPTWSPDGTKIGAFVKCCGCGVSVSCMIKPRFSVRHQRILHRR